MSDIVEIIAKLGLEVTGNDQLQKQIKLFEEEAKAIDELIKKRDNLNKVSAIAEKAGNAEGAKKSKERAQQLTTAINQQTTALQNQVKAQQLVARAAQQELGIIQKLQDKLIDLKQARERQKTVDGIRQINDEIRNLNAEIAKLTDTTQSNSLLSQLFGASSTTGAGKQILQGALAGLGIGVGFSVIPALTSSLVELARAEFDVTTQQGILINSNKELLQSFSDIADEAQKYNQQIIDIANERERAGTIEEESRLLAITKARGIINGEVYSQEIRDLEAANKLRETELQDLKRRKAIIDEVNRVVTESARFGAEFTGNPDVQSFGDPTKNKNVQFELFNNFARQLQQSQLPQQVIDENIQKLREAYDKANTIIGFKGVDLTKVLVEELKKYGQEGAKVAQDIANKQNEIEEAQVAFQAKKRTERFELLKKLSRENEDNQIAIQQAELSRQEKTSEVINKQYDLRGRLATEALNRELEETRKAGNLTVEIEEEYDRKFEQIKEETEAERLQAIRAFNVQQLQEQQKLNEQLLQAELASLNQRIQLLTGTELQANVELRNAISEKELQLQRQANADQYDEQVRALEKKRAEMERAGNTETQEYEQVLQNLYSLFLSYQAKQNEAETAAQAKRIRNIQQGYSDVINVIRQENARVAAETAFGFSEKNLAISEPAGGGFFGRGFASNIAGLRNRRNVAGDTLSSAEAQVGKARQQLAALQAELQKAPAELKGAAQLAVTNAETEVLRLETVINNANAEINNTNRDITLSYVNAWADAFKQIGDIALQGYNTIAEYRQQDIEREISAREKQLEIGLELAKRGNTQVLDEQRNALKQARKEERAAAMEQQAINGALQLSYALLAVAKAAAEGGGVLSAATVAAALGALITGYSIVRSASAASQNRGFKDGVIDLQGPGTDTSDSIPANLSRGESVMTARATRQFKDELTLMQKGIDPYQGLNMAALGGGVAFVTKGEFETLSGKLDEVKDAILSKETHVSQVITKDHVEQMVSEQQRKNRRKYL